MSSFNPQQSRNPQQSERTEIPVRNSFDITRECIVPPRRSARPVSLGDKIFARLVMHGKTVIEFMISTVNNLTELYCLLHSKCKGLRGLAKLYLRNMSRGWSEERPLMLYAEDKKELDKNGSNGNNCARDRWVVRGGYNARPDVTVAMRDVSYGRYFEREVRQLSFPWEL